MRREPASRTSRATESHRSADIGVLENEVTTCDRAAPWEFGIAALMRNLAGRGLLTPLAADQTR